MIFLYILLAVVLLLIFVFTLNVHFIFEYRQKSTITLKVLFFRFNAIDLFHKYLERDSKKNEQKPKKANIEQKKKRKNIDFLGFSDFLIHITKVISLAIKDHFSAAKIDLKELKVSIATEDAAKTALLCGAAIQAANGLCAVLMRFSTFRCNNENLSISPDFLSEETKFSLHLVMTSKVFDLVKLFFNTYFRFFEGKEEKNARNSIKAGH